MIIFSQVIVEYIRVEWNGPHLNRSPSFSFALSKRPTEAPEVEDSLKFKSFFAIALFRFPRHLVCLYGPAPAQPMMLHY